MQNTLAAVLFAIAGLFAIGSTVWRPAVLWVAVLLVSIAGLLITVGS